MPDSAPAELDLMLLFRGEVDDYLTKLNSGLLALETGTAKDPVAAVRELNRLAHSMKGAARSVGLGIVEIVAHYLEDLFEAAMQDRLQLNPSTCDLFYDGLDVIQHVVDSSGNSAEALADILTRLESVVNALPPKSDTRPKPLSAVPCQPWCTQAASHQCPTCYRMSPDNLANAMPRSGGNLFSPSARSAGA